MASVEKLKTCVRVVWYEHGSKQQETLVDTPPTPAGIAHAQSIGDMIDKQISLGIFDRDQVFPNSPNRPAAYFGHYIHQWRAGTEHTVSPITWKTYQSKVAHHIQDYWQHKQISKIKPEHVEHWVYQVLQKSLSPKTITDVVRLWRAIWLYWARDQRNPNDPTQYIKLSQRDSQDIYPFTRQEISRIIEAETHRTLRNLWTVILWSGLSSHELLPLAVEDINTQAGHAHISRGFVKGQHRATKNRRRKRQIELLPIVSDALADQAQIVADNKPVTVKVLDRDHSTQRTERLTWLWHNPNTGGHYEYHQLEKRWRRHLKALDIEYRPLNNGRHTYASQVLSSGAVSAEWLANQLGHVNTDMIHRHYGKFIPDDSKHIIHALDAALNRHPDKTDK